MTKPTATFLWLDLETTGLDPREEAILECGYVITDRNLVSLDADVRVFYMHPEAWTDGEDVPCEIDPFVVAMHTANGLREQCAKSPHGYAAHGGLSAFLRRAIEQYEWDGMEPADDPKAKRLPILAGSTIRFDHSFLCVDVPDVVELLHHRQLDITATMLLAKSVGATFLKGEAHRALDDVLESLKNARTCRAMFEDALKYDDLRT